MKNKLNFAVFGDFMKEFTIEIKDPKLAEKVFGSQGSPDEITGFLLEKGIENYPELIAKWAEYMEWEHREESPLYRGVNISNLPNLRKYGTDRWDSSRPTTKKGTKPNEFIYASPLMSKASEPIYTNRPKCIAIYNGLKFEQDEDHFYLWKLKEGSFKDALLGVLVVK